MKFISVIDVSRIDIKTCGVCGGEVSAPTNSKQVRSAGLDPYMFWIYGCKNDITHMIKIFIDCNICDVGIHFWELENGNMMNLVIQKDNINCLYLKNQKGNDIGSIDVAGLMIDDNLIKKIKGMLVFL